MKFCFPSSFFVALIITSTGSNVSSEARRSSGGRSGRAPPSRSAQRNRSGRGGGSSRKVAPSSRSRRPSTYDEYDDDEEEIDFGKFPGDEAYDDEEEDEEFESGEMYDDYIDEYDFEDVPRRGTGSKGPSRGPGRSSVISSRGRREPPEKDYTRSSRSGSRHGGSGRSGRVVPYGNSRGRSRNPSAFTRGISALRESIPDPNTLKENAINSLSAARETTSKLSSNLYREIKGLTSSELEQVMLKATQPNDVAVKGKHVERLVGVTYQISGKYDIYDAVLRKLWSKMIENDWRTTIKSLYILHRFSADGAPDHQPALKARLRELRRTRDPKRKEKYFNSKMLLAGDSTPDNIAFRSFLGRYAHYVLLRAQCFGGMFTEIGKDPNKVKSKPSPKSRTTKQMSKCMTATCLRNEHLEAAQMLLKAGQACAMKEEEECENTAIALERVVSDLIGLTTAVAVALNLTLSKYFDDEDLDKELVRKWCAFYSEVLLPQTKGMIKQTSPMLDVYGLYLPSRMGATVDQDLLRKGFKASVNIESKAEAEEVLIEEKIESDLTGHSEGEEREEREIGESNEDIKNDDEIEDDVYDGYDYDEYEYDED